MAKLRRSPIHRSIFSTLLRALRYRPVQSADYNDGTFDTIKRLFLGTKFPPEQIPTMVRRLNDLFPRHLPEGSPRRKDFDEIVDDLTSRRRPAKKKSH